MLTTTALTKRFGDRRLWADVDLKFDAGSLTALIGPSGSGKSTLLNCLGLLEEPSSGSIEAEGVDLTSLGMGGRRRFRRDKLGYLFQNYALIENATVGQNLDVALRARRVRGTRAREARIAALERVGLAGREGDRVSRLSGGEQQRVALARLMVKEPVLVLADEPTGALDSDNADVVVATLRELARDGACVVIATHDDRVRDQCDETVSVADYAARG